MPVPRSKRCRPAMLPAATAGDAAFSELLPDVTADDASPRSCASTRAADPRAVSMSGSGLCGAQWTSPLTGDNEYTDGRANALAENMWSVIKTECVRRSCPFPTRDDAEIAVSSTSTRFTTRPVSRNAWAGSPGGIRSRVPEHRDASTCRGDRPHPHPPRKPTPTGEPEPPPPPPPPDQQSESHTVTCPLSTPSTPQANGGSISGRGIRPTAGPGGRGRGVRGGCRRPTTAPTG